MIALLLYGFHRRYGKSYLQHWTLGWTALAVYHLTTGAAHALAIRFELAALHPLRVGVSLVAGMSGFLEIGWLLFGVYELVRRRPVRLLDERRILTALAIAGAVTTVFLISPEIPAETRALALVGVRNATAAIAFGLAAIAVWQARRRQRTGFTILSLAFGAYAIVHMQYVVLGAMRSEAYVSYIGFIEVLLQSALAIGMIACLLEDEREAAELAASEIEHLAYHDALTGLPNRPLFIDRLIVSLAQATRGRYELAVLFLDLDRFKDINDSLGHSVGDMLLKSLSDRIKRCVREGDTVARFGGDEFTLLIPRVEQVEDAAKIAQKIIETVKIPFNIHEHELFVTASIGLSIFPTDGIDAETLVRNADTAMYRAKEQGRDHYQLYAPAMNARALERLALENMLRKAITQNELVLHYQPLIDTQTRTVIGAEALVRWRHPDLGLLLPGHFISTAETSGLIVPIGEWVLRTACNQARAWERKNPGFVVSVNLSARQFQQPDLLDQIRKAIDGAGIEPSRLQLEITESNAMQNAQNTIRTLRELKALGIRIAMDDFGTGYSSLSYLKRFPIDVLKLDSTFINDVTTDPSAAAIVSAVIVMAHSLGLKVVAEGVETEAQLEFLVRESCDVLQGFLFSSPVPADVMEQRLSGVAPVSEVRRRSSDSHPAFRV
ncbi:MAG TPA: EAL domain-containing protein [Thermoanaerobaculia bacterium]|nr:EAL domain-containing protein [Thermoanaerobaculia bacterium]